MDPFSMLLFGAGNNPAQWAPLLDALGPGFSPDQLMPFLQQASLGGNPGMFAQPGAGLPTDPTDPSVINPTGGTFPALQTGTGVPGAAPLGAGRTQQPSVVRPEVPKPVFNAGVTGAQKAPDFGGAGGNLIQLLMQQALAQGGKPPVANLGALLGGAV